jgi:hypothetical protein
VKPETKLYQKFKKKTPAINWTRLESWASFGVPDLLGYHNNCGFFMVELKIQTGNKIKFSPHQILFHTTRTKRNFILVEQAAEPGPRSVKLYSSSEINNLISDPRAASPLAADDFRTNAKNFNRQRLTARRCQCDILPQLCACDLRAHPPGKIKKNKTKTIRGQRSL